MKGALARGAVATLAALALAVAPIVPAHADPLVKATGALRGISLAGAEFSSTGLPVFDNAESFAYIASRGYTVVRLPFQWESIQPVLGGPLKPESMERLDTAVTDAGNAGLSVILDVHNYAKYNGKAYGTAGSFTSADFSDLWTRLAREFTDNATVVGYGLMNEPRALPAVDGVSGNERWQRAQQAALTAIRAVGDVTCVLVSGYDSGSLGAWLNPTNGQPVPYITDPANNFRWEAHHYWDVGATGTYSSSYADAVAAGYGTSQGDAERTRTYFELNQWIEWLKKYNQKGYIGEFGWPSEQNAVSASDAASWNSLAQMYLARVDQEQSDLLWTTAWATGSRWSASYVLQFYGSTDGVLSSPLSNAAVLEASARVKNPVADPPQATPPPQTAPPPDEAPPVIDPTPPPIAAPVDMPPAVPAKAKSHVKFTLRTSGKTLVIRVTSSKRVSGRVTVTRKGKVIARAKLVGGKAVIRFAKKSSRKLTVRYAGSTTVAASRLVKKK